MLMMVVVFLVLLLVEVSLLALAEVRLALLCCEFGRLMWSCVSSRTA